MDTLNLVLSLLAVFTSVACTAFLFRGYATSGTRLLFWSALCFVFLSANSLLLFLDLVVFPEIDLRPYRLGTALAGIVCLLYGFIREAS